jgi:hypothetical protein
MFKLEPHVTFVDIDKKTESLSVEHSNIMWNTNTIFSTNRIMSVEDLKGATLIVNPTLASNLPPAGLSLIQDNFKTYQTDLQHLKIKSFQLSFDHRIILIIPVSDLKVGTEAALFLHLPIISRNPLRTLNGCTEFIKVGRDTLGSLRFMLDAIRGEPCFAKISLFPLEVVVWCRISVAHVSKYCALIRISLASLESPRILHQKPQKKGLDESDNNSTGLSGFKHNHCKEINRVGFCIIPAADFWSFQLV